jgi:hypothetical protein
MRKKELGYNNLFFLFCWEKKGQILDIKKLGKKNLNRKIYINISYICIYMIGNLAILHHHHHPPIPLGTKCSLLMRKAKHLWPLFSLVEDALFSSQLQNLVMIAYFYHTHTCITKLPFLTPLLLSSRY